MAIAPAYQVVKDLIALAKMEEADSVDPGTSDVQKLVVMGSPIAPMAMPIAGFVRARLP